MDKRHPQKIYSKGGFPVKGVYLPVKYRFLT